MDSLNIMDKMQQYFIDCNNSKNYKVLGPVCAHTVGPVAMSVVRALVAINLIFEGLKEIFGKVALKIILLPINLVAKICSKNTLNNPYSIKRGVHSIGQACILGLKTPRVFLVNLVSPNLAKVEQDLKQAQDEIADLKARHTEISNLEQPLQDAATIKAEKEQIEARLLQWHQRFGGEETEFSLSLMDNILQGLVDQEERELAVQQEFSNQFVGQQATINSLQSTNQMLASQNQAQERTIHNLREEISILQQGGEVQSQTIASQSLAIGQLSEQVRLLQEQLQTQAESVRLVSKPIEKENLSDSETLSMDSQTRQQGEPTVNEYSADNNGSHLSAPKPSTCRRSLTTENASMADLIKAKRDAMKAKVASNQENKETEVQSEIHSQIPKSTEYVPEAFQGMSRATDQFAGAVANQYNANEKQVKSDLVEEVTGKVKFGEVQNTNQMRAIIQQEVPLNQQKLLTSYLDDVASDEARGVPFEAAAEKHSESRMLTKASMSRNTFTTIPLSSADLYDNNFTGTYNDGSWQQSNIANTETNVSYSPNVITDSQILPVTQSSSFSTQKSANAFGVVLRRVNAGDY